MVKVGFICEGQTETELLSSPCFVSYLNAIGLDFAGTVDAKGSGNLLSYNIGGYIQTLEVLGSEKIILLTDLDEDTCITITKNRINARQQDIAVIAVKKIEAWFLASTQTMRKLLGDDEFQFQFPENEREPFETINQLLVTNSDRGRGIGKKSSGKVRLVRRLIALGLDISEAAAHPNCSSATYFIKKLGELTKTAVTGTQEPE